MTERVDLLQGLLAERCVRIGIKKQKAQKIAGTVHGHGVTGVIALSGDTFGVLPVGGGEDLQIVYHPWPPFLQDLEQRPRLAEPRLIMGQGLIAAAAVHEGLQEIGLGIVDRGRDAGDERKAFFESSVNIFQLFRQTDVAVQRIELVFVIKHHRYSCHG